MTLQISDREREALAEVTTFPLLAAITGRRSRRFPLGGRIPDGPLAYTSGHPVRPISEVERALILSVVGGVTGWHYGITYHPGYAPAFPNYSGSATGRTFPSAAGFHTSQLFFTDDTGIYLLPTRDEPPREFASIEDWITHTADSYVRISDKRLELPREEPYMEGHNTWIGNHPGSLLAFPVADLAEHLIANLSFFAANGYLVYDDVNNRSLPGTEKFSSLRNYDDPIPLSFVEQYTLTEASAELATATHNGVLLLQALGLGGWMFDGLDRLSVLGGSGDPRAPGIGFRSDNDDRWPFPNATGLDGFFETLSPPHVPTVAAGVQKYIERKYGPGGPFHPDTPGAWVDSRKVRAAALPAEAIQEIVTTQASYIYDTFGKIPGTVPTVHVLMYLQAQNIDLGFYDAHFGPGAYLSTHAEHGRRWYGD
ncbi:MULTISPECIES: hypothetical protein [Mycobacteroides]|jgi:hypothetical protein|uniref:Uncharacterized protein n=1 Tax=Mycobacteroides chelonae TaxID=1774 RepID=A0AB73MU70_MYCCH|nr:MULTISPECIES: hypothetical protein [Mycobacteroides]KRQ27954.1 hypothetical protein AOT86_10355 [Mycobacteroides sp. H072]KRQ41622.1 hypothetical protein AOT84_01840 [Mycobacteroides sp. H002]KRQ49937.1 hypothetical protein AOT85_15710 [Mycobacteroides sp. H054]KRQ67507.1 hypothetical protein AOT83_20495 [Mycobacteroides sp. H001]MBF9329109.1 hypothetical protein [Mycobacteroides chelonae]